ncbi:MAG: TIGR02444 family protein [Halioglobus sp.]
MSNEFWEFSLATYATDGVSDSALAVQDEMGLDINLILYATWLASLELKLTGEHLAGLQHLTERWQQEVVIPLRGVRTRLKSDPSAAELRNQVKAIELSSERHQQELMWSYFNAADPLPSGVHSLGENLAMLLSPGATPAPSWAVLEDKLSRASSG